MTTQPFYVLKISFSEVAYFSIELSPCNLKLCDAAVVITSQAFACTMLLLVAAGN
jgi:hypothetical protein